MKFSMAYNAFFTFTFFTALQQVIAAAVVITNGPNSVIPRVASTVVLPRQINQRGHSNGSERTSNTSSTGKPSSPPRYSSHSTISGTSLLSTTSSSQTCVLPEFNNDENIALPATIQSCMVFLTVLQGAGQDERAGVGARGFEAVDGFDGRFCAIEWSAAALDADPPFLLDLSVELSSVLQLIQAGGEQEVKAVLKNVQLNGICTDLCFFDANSERSSCRP